MVGVSELSALSGDDIDISSKGSSMSGGVSMSVLMSGADISGDMSRFSDAGEGEQAETRSIRASVDMTKEL